MATLTTAPAGSATRRWPDLNFVYLCTAVALIALRPLLTPVPPHDFWWHIATGRLIVERGAIPEVDVFSYTRAGETFYNQSWLAQLLMYWLHSLGGVQLLVLVQASVLALAYGLILLICIRRSGALRLSVALLLLTTMPLSFDNWTIRPQSYVFPIFAAFLYILTEWRFKNGGRWTYETVPPATNAPHPPSPISRHKLWLLPPLMVLWVNMHGSFVLGGALIMLVFLGEAGGRLAARWRGEQIQGPPLRQLLLWGALTAATLLLNPRGIEVLGYVRNLLSSSQVTTLVEEWAAPTIRDPGGLIFFIFVIFTMLVLAYTRRRPDLSDTLLLVAFLWLALGAVRNIVWFGMVVTPLITTQLAMERPRPSRTSQGHPTINAAILGLLALMLLLALPWVKPVLGLPPELGNLLDERTPVAAVAALRDDPERPERIFNTMSYGSYLAWAAPEQKVFIDTRIELYPFSQWQDYLSISGGRDLAALQQSYGFDGALVDKKEQTGLLRKLRSDPAWQVRYEDEVSAYLVRR